jgi:hypothetical protein
LGGGGRRKRKNNVEHARTQQFDIALTAQTLPTTQTTTTTTTPPNNTQRACLLLDLLAARRDDGDRPAARARASLALHRTRLEVGHILGQGHVGVDGLARRRLGRALLGGRHLEVGVRLFVLGLRAARVGLLVAVWL